MQQGVPQRDIFIVGGDIDQRACDITFVELSLLGYAARIDHLDALELKQYSRPRWTIGYFLHGTQWRERRQMIKDACNAVPDVSQPETNNQQPTTDNQSLVQGTFLL